MATKTKRPPHPIKYHGGKAPLADRIIRLMPPHTRYIEPFFGGGAVLFRKDPEGVSEFVNDLNGALINFWRVLAQTPDRMLHALWATPLSPLMFEEAQNFADHPDAVKRATSFFIRYRMSRQGLGKDYCTPTRRLRRGMNEQVSAWLTAIDGLPEAHERLKRVEIWNMDANDFIRKLDSPDTLVYADPPYLHETRSSVGEYGEFEMTFEDHGRLLATLGSIQGKFILSGYRSEVYDEAAEAFGWHRTDIETDNKASSAKVKERKTECLWTNYQPPCNPCPRKSI